MCPLLDANSIIYILKKGEPEREKMWAFSKRIYWDGERERIRQATGKQKL
jgi:hypothetical protein